MRRLTPEEMNIPAGGGTPGLVCKTTDSTSSVSGNMTLTHASEICQTSSGLTIITTTDTTKFSGEIGITGKIRALAGLEVKAGWERTSTDITVCKPSGDCTTTHKESMTGPKGSDAAGGSAFESFADFGSDGWGDNAGWGDGGAWAGGEGGGMGGGGGSLFDDEYEIAMC